MMSPRTAIITPFLFRFPDLYNTTVPRTMAMIPQRYGYMTKEAILTKNPTIPAIVNSFSVADAIGITAYPRWAAGGDT